MAVDATRAGTDLPDLDTRLQRFVGHALGEPNVARDPVNEPMIRHWCDAMGDRVPAYTDPAAAAASVHRGIVAPPTMLQAWTMRGLLPPSAPAAPAPGDAPTVGDAPARADAPTVGDARSGTDAPTPEQASVGGQADVGAVLDEAGYTSVVATNCEQRYHRYLRPGDLLTERTTVEDVSPVKRTALGEGHFVTTLRTYHDQHGELVGEMRFRLLKFMPGRRAAVEGAAGGTPSDRAAVGAAAAVSPGPAGAAVGAEDVPWPRPAVNRDTAFFWEGTRRGELRIQRCTSCGRLRHPPTPGCPHCGSLARDWIVAAGTGTVYSFVVHHHPPVPPLELPFVVAVVALDEGTRIVGNLIDVDPAEVAVGMPVEVAFVAVDEDLVLPQWRPRRNASLSNGGPGSDSGPQSDGGSVSDSGPQSDGPATGGAVAQGRPGTRAFGEVGVGDRLPPLDVPITPTLIVAGAIASRDYQDVHHDRDGAVERGSKDIFMNILTTNGLVGRYVTDWAGPDAVLQHVAIRLGAPNYPGDTMRLTGEVTGREEVDGEGTVTVSVTGSNQLGDHVVGTVRLVLPGGSAS